jgi:hypothetical protein
MPKERYVTPEVRSDTLEPEALCCRGSANKYDFVEGNHRATTSFCCDEVSKPKYPCFPTYTHR